MSYQIIDVDITEALRDVILEPGRTGAGILIRRQGRPIDFWMQALPQGRMSADKLAVRIAERSATTILREILREELPRRPLPASLPSVTVAVCTKDRPELVARLLDSLDRMEPVAASLEVLIVDNAPVDARTRELVEKRKGVRYVVEPRPGLDFARNRAVQEAGTDLLAFLDDDVTADRTWLAGLMEAWAENPDAAAFTGLVLPYELETEAQILFERRGGFQRGFDKIRYGRAHPTNRHYPCGAGDFGAGANMAFRLDVLRALGGFDEALDTGAPLPGGGDLDIFFRVVRGGHVLVYEPRYLVFHQHRRELKALRRQYESWGRGFMAYVAKSYEQADPAQRAQFRGLVLWWFRYLAGQIGGAMRAGDGRRTGMVMAEMRGGIAGLFGEYGRSRRRIERIRRQYA
jgi:glycosyltransferase involved in cell wall biosynthesis